MGRTGDRRRIALPVAGALLVAFVAAVALLRAPTARADEFTINHPVILAAQKAADAEWELDLFSTYHNVRTILGQGQPSMTPLRIPLPFVKKWADVHSADARVFLDDSKRSMALQVHIQESIGWPGDRIPVADIVVTAKWPDPSEDPGGTSEDPVITVTVKVDAISLLHLSRISDDLDGVSFYLDTGWLLYSNTAQESLDLAGLPTGIKSFFRPINEATNDLLPGGQALVLDPDRTNFYGDIALVQEPELRRAVSLAGVDESHLRIQGTIGVDAAVIFEDDPIVDPIAVDLTASLSTKGSNPPPWLEDRTFSARLTLNDLLNPELELTDTIDTLVGGARNVFRNGFSFEPAAWAGAIDGLPLTFSYELDGVSLSKPFDIDIPALLGVGGSDDIAVGLDVQATVDLSDPRIVTAFEVAITAELPTAPGGPATVRLALQVDPDHGVVVGEFTVDLSLSAQAVVDAIAAAVGAPTFDTGPLGELTIEQIKLVARNVSGATEVSVSASLGAYDDVLGLDWLDLTDLTVTMGVANGVPGEALFDTPVFSASVAATFEVVGITWNVRVEVTAGDGEAEASIHVSLGPGQSVDLSGLVSLISLEVPGDHDLGDLLAGLNLQNLSLRLRVGTEGVSFDAITDVVVPDLFAATLYLRAASPADPGAAPELFLGLRPAEQVTLGDIVRSASGGPGAPGLEGVELPNLGLIFTIAPVEAKAHELSPEGYQFFKVLMGCKPNDTQPNVLGEGGCAFSRDLKLRPGANLVANIALPEELDGLATALWMDRSKGLQFLGTIVAPVPGPGATGGKSDAALRLELFLPEIVPPAEVDFLERGSLSIGIEARDGSIALFLKGSLDTRFRRSAPNPSSCPLGTLMVGHDVEEDGSATTNEYCYDRLRFGVEARLALTTTSLKLQLSGQLLSLDPIGWQQPFGIEWLTIRSLAIQLTVEAAAPDFFPAFKIGVGGDIILGDPQAGGKRLAASLSIGVAFKPAPTPAGFTIVPSFGGVRAYVSSLGTTDLARLYELVMGEAPPPLGDFPLMEVRNAEFMFALENNAPLCLQQGIAVAGELYLVEELSAPGPVVLPEVDDDGCAEFGALVDPETCATTRRDEGCFAAVNVQILTSGILIDGSIGAIELGPVSFDDARLRIALLPEDQSFVVRGGITIGTLAQGKLAVSLSSEGASFYGYLTMFQRFLVQVRAELDLTDLSLLDPLPNLSFEAVLQGDFDAFVQDTLQSMLDGLRSDLADLEEAWRKIEAAAADTFNDAVELAFGLIGHAPPSWVGGVDQALTGWFEEVADAVAEFVDEMIGLRIDPPSLSAVIAGGNGSISYRGFPVCGLLEVYDQSQGRCVDGDGNLKGVPFVTCFPFLGTGALEPGTNEPRCTLLIETPGLAGLFPGAPPDLAQALQELADDLAEHATRLATGIAGFLENPSLTALFDTFLGDLAAPNVFSLECASFGFDTADAGPVVAAKLKIGVLGETFGFDEPVNLANPDLLGLFERIMQGFLGDGPASVDCTDALEPPPGVSDAGFLELTTTVSPTRVVEGGTVVLQGGFSDDPGSSAVTVDWGDDPGAAPEPVAVVDGTFTASHRYLDNPAPPATSFTVTVLVDGAPSAIHQVVVTNARPEAQLDLAPEAVDEGSPVRLSIDVSDPGELDTHRAEVAWGDGNSVEVALPLTSPIEHVYRDDDPSGTPEDDYTVTVRVTDKDGGTTLTSATVTVRNVAPLVTSDVPTETQEGSEVAFDVTWDDPGLDDQHVVRVFWGDGTVTTRRPSLGERSVHVSHVYADDDPTGTSVDPYTIEVRVSDDDLGVGTRASTIMVANVEPAVCLSFVAADAAAFAEGTACPVGPATTIDEGPGEDPWPDTGHVVIHGGIVDPGLPDDHVVVVDWGYDGDGFAPVVLGDPSLVSLPGSFPGDEHFPFDSEELAGLAHLPPFERGERTFEAARTYGDNGVFTIRAWVIDDDLGVGMAEATVAVGNVDPAVAIDANLDRPDVVLADGPVDDGVLDTPTFLTRASAGLSLAADATDPGSDDLRFTWSWDDGQQATTSDHLLRDGDGVADGLPSPEVAARTDVRDEQIASWAQPCLYNVGLEVTDDDLGWTARWPAWLPELPEGFVDLAGRATDDAWVVVTGIDHRVRNAGWWDTQFDFSRRNRNRNDLDAATLTCYTDIARHMSQVFDTHRSTDTFESVRSVLLQASMDADDDKLDRQLLTTWLNLAHGSLGWFSEVATPEGQMPLLDALRRAEQVWVHPDADSVRAQRIAWKDALEAVNG
jgi:hypothetical protein